MLTDTNDSSNINCRNSGNSNCISSSSTGCANSSNNNCATSSNNNVACSGYFYSHTYTYHLIIQNYGQKCSWENPTDWLIQTYPWSLDSADLLHLRAEDVGYDKQIPISSKSTDDRHSVSSKDSQDHASTTASTTDPLYNMIMRLREASSYSPSSSSPSDADADQIESPRAGADILDTA